MYIIIVPKWKIKNGILWKLGSTVEEFNNMLYEYHTDTCLCNYKELKKKLNENKIGYIGIDNII